MNASTVLGVIIGILMLVMAIAIGVSGQEIWRIEKAWGIFINIPGFFIVFGGTMAATLISFHSPLLISVFHSLNVVFKQPSSSPRKYIPEITRLSSLARNSNLELERVLEEIKNPFLKDGIQMLSDQFKQNEIAEILQQRIDFRIHKEFEEAHVFRTMARFAPAFGMIGTLIGLVGMLSNMGADESIGRIGGDMAVALVTTFYGLILANLFFIPFANKLENRSRENSDKMRMIVESIQMIAESWHPRKIEDYLNSFVRPSERIITDLRPSSLFRDKADHRSKGDI